ncbi:tetraspanin-32 isoform X6 [Dipodomys merriami]|uniref:tetraspanin-32 isoform X6 n=1 Tax=Dipodomys merriami TaxID=94247 RepID=UPI00385581E8
MALRSRVKFAKCQMLVTSFFVLLLSLAGASIVVLTHFGDHFTVISRAPLERSPFQSLDRWVFAVGIVLAGLLGLGAALSAAATVREAQGLMAGGFLCFALVFLALAQVAFWRLRNPTQVEDAVLDTYDLVYDQAVRSPLDTLSQELTAIQDTVYAMLLSAFLWLAIHKGCGLDHKGGYSLTPRAHGYQCPEPSLFRQFQEAPVPRHPSEAEAIL